MMQWDMLKELLEAVGPSGRETQIAALLKSRVRPDAETAFDNMGNLIAVKRGTSGKRVMLSAHMDQIGLAVTDIDKNGYLRVAPVGGWEPYEFTARPVIFENGVLGVTYNEIDSERKKPLATDELFIDIGARTKGEAEATVSIGDMAVLFSDYFELGGRVSAAALDNRLGCWMLLEVLNSAESPHDLYCVFTSQEEVGLRGAGAAAYTIQPDFAVNVDVTDAGDTPKGEKVAVALGLGPAIKAMDSSVIVNAEVRRFMQDTAERFGIPCQTEVLKQGGTDTGAIQRSRGGVLAGCVSIPARYIHTQVETVDKADAENGILLLKALVEAPELP